MSFSCHLANPFLIFNTLLTIFPFFLLVYLIFGGLLTIIPRTVLKRLLGIPNSLLKAHSGYSQYPRKLYQEGFSKIGTLIMDLLDDDSNLNFPFKKSQNNKKSVKIPEVKQKIRSTVIMSMFVMYQSGRTVCPCQLPGQIDIFKCGQTVRPWQPRRLDTLH